MKDPEAEKIAALAISIQDQCSEEGADADKIIYEAIRDVRKLRRQLREALGNSMAVPVLAWIGGRIKQVLGGT
jgi:site-specific DNA-cytosine methylase